MSKETVLKQIFDNYMEESIDDEQVQRILEPVLEMIKEGKFERSKSSSRWRKSIFVQPDMTETQRQMPGKFDRD